MPLARFPLLPDESLMAKLSVLTAPGEITIREEPPPHLDSGEVRLQIAFAGICGTDVSIWSGDYPVPLPLTLGHEFSGVVHEVSSREHEHLLGRRVVAEINNSCLAYEREVLCAACRRGFPTHCLTRTVTGIINHPGAFAQMLSVPVGNVHALPEELPLEQAVLVEPLAAAIRTFELTPLAAGDAVVVLGCGRLGRLVALVAKKLGARVVAVGRSKKHLQLIAPFVDQLVAFQPREEIGHVETVATAEKLREYVLDLTHGLGADVVVEATASNENLLLAQQLVRPLGTVALKSTCGRPVPQLDTTYSAVHEIRFQGSRCGPFDKAVEFMQQYGLPGTDWITARYPLARIGEALEAARTEAKVLVEVGGAE